MRAFRLQDRLYLPFTLPDTYASKANTGYGATFQFGSPWQSVLEIKSFRISGGSVAVVENTHLLSPARTAEFTPGIITPGEYEATANFIGDDSQLAITPQMQAGAIFNVRVVAPVQRNTKTYTQVAQGFFTKYEVGPFEVSKDVDLVFGIKITGVATEAVAS